MLKVIYNICYETGNSYEPIDYYTEVTYVPWETTTTQIFTMLQEEIDSLNKHCNNRVWLGEVDFEEANEDEYNEH